MPTYSGVWTLQQVSDGITATNSTSPITVTGLTDGVSYIFTVAAGNVLGYGPESAASNSVTPVAPAIGLFGGGYTNAYTSAISYITISTTGNATSFGSLTAATGYGLAGCSSQNGGVQ